ncbi:MAG: hypothetical protein ACLGH0_04070 [Thermoanaerobaculia bacterium]
MSRVERTENPSERRGSEQLRQAERGRSSGTGPRRADDPNPGHTPTKAEGEVGDIEQALENQNE